MAGLDIDPIAAMLNPSSFQQVLHITIASYVATGAAVAGIHAWMLLRDRSNQFHRHALAIALAVAGVSAVLQPLSGHHSAQVVAETQLTLWLLLIALAAGALVLFPSIYFLFRIFKGPDAFRVEASTAQEQGE